MEARLENAGLETRKMFEQIMLKLEAHRDVGFEGSGSTGSLDMKQKGIMGVMPENRASSGRWVAEIKDTTQKIRLWLGTFESAEEAARAYDEAACLLRGSNTRTNFVTQVSLDSPLASRIRNLLNSKKGAKQQSVLVSTHTSFSPSTSSSTSSSSGGSSNENSFPIGTVQDIQLFDHAYKPDMSNCTREFEFASSQSDFSYTSEPGFDRFLYTQEIMNLPKNVLSPEETGSELTEFQRMKVERQISASLYAMNGVQEYMETVHDSAEPCGIFHHYALCSAK